MTQIRRTSEKPPADRPLTVPVLIELELLEAVIDSDLPGTTRNEKLLNAIRRGLELEEEAKAEK